MERSISDINSKLNEFTEEGNKNVLKRQQIKESLEKIEKDIQQLNDRKIIHSFPLNIFGIKVLSSDFNTLRIQIFKKINLNFKFRNFNPKIFQKIDNLNNPNYYLNLENINFEIIRTNPSLSEKLIDDSNCYKILKVMYEDVIETVINTYEFNFQIFKEKIKYIIKYSSSFLFFYEILSAVWAFGIDVHFKYEKSCKSAFIRFSVLSKFGLRVVFLFEFEILNSFFGFHLRETDIINVSLSETNFAKYRNKTSSFLEDYSKFLSEKERIKNPVFIKENLFKLYDNILNLRIDLI